MESILLRKILKALQSQHGYAGIPGVQSTDSQQIPPYFECNLDQLPYPAWSLLDLASYGASVRRDLFVQPVAPIVGSRGCPYRCAFCLSGLVKYRRHSYSYIATEAGVLQERYGVRAVIFYDDCLFPNSLEVNEQVCAFSRLISASAPELLWQIEIRPDVFCGLSDEALLKMLSAGCRQINLGIEKGNYSQLESICKPFDISTLIGRCSSVAKRFSNLRLTGTFILGGPGETLETIKETVELSTRLNLIFAHFYPLELYPGTKLYDSAFPENKRAWFDRVMSDPMRWGEIVYENSQISRDLLLDIVHSAYHQFYNRVDWQNLAKAQLGANYDNILTTTKSWEIDRFGLGRGKEH